jgi:light-regulated signal transduction histidine kinase (bacteriophytochrome)
MADDKLAAYTAELERQNSELEQFAYVASHDLQEPLRKIQTFSELIMENFDNREYVDRYFQKLNSSAKRMSELIKSLLNYSRLSKDKENSVMTAVDLNAVINEVKQDLELLIEDKKAVIIVEQLPEIAGNHIQLGQLFSNLLSNALKFSRVDPVIKISSKIVAKEQIADAPATLLDRNYHQVSFEDNGIGFEEQYSKIIFSLFQRLHGKQSYAGTGIGLALCKKIAENHNGFISAESGSGKGAIFNVYLPVKA